MLGAMVIDDGHDRRSTAAAARNTRNLFSTSAAVTNTTNSVPLAIIPVDGEREVDESNEAEQRSAALRFVKTRENDSSVIHDLVTLPPCNRRSGAEDRSQQIVKNRQDDNNDDDEQQRRRRQQKQENDH